MLEYPYFYENNALNQDENFLIFSLDPVLENSELNLAYAYSLPICIELSLFDLGYEFCSKFCKQIAQLYNNFEVIPTTQTFICYYDRFYNFI